jgi:hypothetical protein
MYRQLLPDQIRVLGAEHPNTVLSRYRVARALQAQGDLGRAEAEYRVVLAAEIYRLGVEHPEAMNTCREVADVLLQRRDLNSAITEYRQLLADRLQMLGTDHLDTLTSEEGLGGLELRDTQSTAVAKQNETWELQ